MSSWLAEGGHNKKTGPNIFSCRHKYFSTEKSRDPTRTVSTLFGHYMTSIPFRFGYHRKTKSFSNPPHGSIY